MDTTDSTYLILWVDSCRANLQAHGHTEHRCLQLHAAQRAHASPRLPRKTSRLAKALHKALTNRRRRRGRMKFVSYIFYGQVFLRCFPGVETAARCTIGRRWAKGGFGKLQSFYDLPLYDSMSNTLHAATSARLAHISWSLQHFL